MAEKPPQRAVDLDHNQLCCSVCLDLFRESVTVPCGHSYCRSCIEVCWQQEEAAAKGRYSCPQCREVFQSRPILGKNNILAEVVEKLKGTSTKQTSLSAGPEDVACDFCCGTERNKASMSCLTCLASYCDSHLAPHYRVPVLKTHQLVSVTVSLKTKMCKTHNKLMEVYCQTDKSCVCYLCGIDEHWGHRIVSAIAERATEQKQLIENQTINQKRLHDREHELKQLGKALKDFNTFPALSTSCESPDLPPGAVVRPSESMETASQFMGKLKDDIEHLLEDFLPKFSAKVSAVNVLLPPVPKSREQFLLSIWPSEEQRRVTYQTNCLYYSSHSDRFESMQVLCREALSERCYWEVHWKGSFCAIAVAYKDICRSSNGSEFGFNDKSWSLEFSKDTYTFRHRYETKTLSGPLSFCVGVYLDYKAGTLAFYSISEKMTLLHKEQTGFSQPLYPGFGLKCNAYTTRDYVELVKLW